MILCSCLTKGRTMKKIPIGIIKNWFPPQAEIDKDVKIPAEISLKITTFLFLEFMPLRSK